MRVRHTHAVLAPLVVATISLSVGCEKPRAIAANDVRSDQTRQAADHREGVSMETETATFAAGCFWGVEETFRQTPGVVSTEVGYSGGATVAPTYKQVCGDNTGHAEAVRVVFDPNVITYDQLLDVFWKCHNPTTRNRQGPDIGTQYRSVIFYDSPEQQAAAEASKQRLADSGKYSKEIVTEIVPAAPFYRAEEYHQQYLAKRGGGVCPSGGGH